MPFHDGKEVDQVTEDRENNCESQILLKQCSGKAMERLQEKGNIRDEAEGNEKLKELRVKKTNEDICHVLTAAEDKRYDGDQSRSARYHFRSRQDLPARKEKSENVAAKGGGFSRVRRTEKHRKTWTCCS